VNDSSPHFVGDISLISGIEAVPTILQVICNATGMGFAAVARVREGRWVACSVVDQIEVGLRPGDELPVENTIYDETRTPHQEVIIDRASERLGLGHPALAVYGIQSYISMPIILRNGSLFGALCASDRKPRRLNVPGTVGMFKLFAELIAIQIDSTGRLASSEANLEDERKTAELREQFVAILGHDLRNPLASIQGAAELLMKRTLDHRSKQIVGMMRSSAARMSELINNVLDLTQARLGGGFQLNRTTGKDLAPVLEQVISELRLASPECTIEMECKLDKPISCDRVRIAQLFSNILGNACRHGETTAPIRVFAETADAVFKLSVTNSGTPIPALEMQRLFQPYVRGAASGSSQGLGLGLYIASEIARAHGGMLTATSSAEETRFTLRMPLQ
jgi:signal transduction histidine kinase